MENYLVAENLKKVYSEGNKEVVAISEINLSLKQGEILVVFGPSGSGKSTLLHLLGGLDRPTEGKVLLDGTDLSLLSDEKLARVRNEKFGFIFQFYHLLSEFTILENVLLPLFIGKKKILKSPGKEQKTFWLNLALTREFIFIRLLSPGENNSGWRSPAPSSIIRKLSLPMNPPEIWIKKPVISFGNASWN